MEKEYITWESYIQLINKLAKKIHGKFDSIICINRGGLIVGRILSDTLELPLGVISAKCYKKGHSTMENINLQPTISHIDSIGNKILLVDDLVDSGKTMEKVIEFLKTDIPQSRITTAVIYKKPNASYEPNFDLGIKKDWIVFPYEKIEFK